MKRYIFATILLFLSYFPLIFGQISTHEKPFSFKSDISDFKKNARTEKRLPSLDMKKIEMEDEEDDARGMPPRFGYRQKVDYNLKIPANGILCRMAIKYGD